MVKVLKFRVSNGSSSPLEGDENKAWHIQQLREVITPQQIEDTISSVVGARKIVSLTVSTVEVNKHNNARGNTVDLWYTLVLEPR